MKILSSIKSMIGGVGYILDEVITSKEELLKAKNGINQTILEYGQKIAVEQSKLIESESKGNWLQRSWRPIIMLCFGFIVVYAYFLDPVFGSGTASDKIPKDFFTLLEIGLGGYVVGRSLEKITSTVGDKILSKKK